MNEILSKLAQCIEVGKIDKACPYPPNMKDQDGANELTKKALENGIKPTEILEKALIPAMADVLDVNVGFPGVDDVKLLPETVVRRIVTDLGLLYK